MSASAASRPSRDVWNSIDILSFEKILSFELTQNYDFVNWISLFVSIAQERDFV